MMWFHNGLQNEEIKLSLKINNLKHMSQKMISIVKSNFIFSKFCIYIYIYIDWI